MLRNTTNFLLIHLSVIIVLFDIIGMMWNIYCLCWLKLIKPKRRYWSQQRHSTHATWHKPVFAFWLLILALALREGHWAGSRMWLYSLISQTKAEVWQVRKGEGNWIHLWLPPTPTHATMPYKKRTQHPKYHYSYTCCQSWQLGG